MKIEKLSNKKFAQLSSVVMKTVAGGTESSSRSEYNGNSTWTYYPDTYEYWSNANGDPNPNGRTMDQQQFQQPYVVSYR